MSPFDLHVLGTPPAFILSQDQTLKINFLLVSVNNWSCYLSESAPILWIVRIISI